MINIFAKYLKATPCAYNTDMCFAKSYKRISGANYPYMGGYYVMLENGAAVLFWPRGEACEVKVDLNGNKKPNVMGKDFFAFIVTTKSKKPVQFYGEEYYNPGASWVYKKNTIQDLINTSNFGCNKNSEGIYCGALIQAEGWKIPEYYPW